MELTQTEIAELKSILKNRGKSQVKPASPTGRIKLLVGPHGRVTGRVLVFKGDKPPKGSRLINDDPRARIGMLANGNTVAQKSGKTDVYEIVNAAGDVDGAIVVDPDELPKVSNGYSLRLRSAKNGKTKETK